MHKFVQTPENVRIVVVRAGTQPWFLPGWKLLPTRMGYCSKHRCEDKNVDFTRAEGGALSQIMMK